MTTEQRSKTMRAVKSRDTGPEMVVRRLTHRMGYRYRLHRADLPGKPDLAFSSRRAVIFVHGCFWHGHQCKRGARTPKTNTDYWTAKIARNIERDKDHRTRLKRLKWRSLILWECELKDEDGLRAKIRRFLG